MERNIGLFDLTLRIILGLTIVIAGYMATASVIPIILGMITIAIGIAGWCPVYAAFGHTSIKKKNGYL